MTVDSEINPDTAGIGYYVSCCINPLVYCVMSRRFRRGLANVSTCMAANKHSSIGTPGGAGQTFYSYRILHISCQ